MNKLFEKFKSKPKIAPVQAKTPEELEAENRLKEAEKVKIAHKNLKALQDLWINLEWSSGNRQARKQFRREFINNDKFSDATIQRVIRWHEEMIAYLQKPVVKKEEPKKEETQNVQTS